MDLQVAEILASEKLQELQSFLESNKLPSQDIQLEDHLFLGYFDHEGNLVGSGGIEIYGSAALLRSIAVKSSERGKRLGQQIVGDVMKRVKELKIQSVFLLTETAEGFFLKLGFKEVSRDDVPAEIKASTEFSFICPVSAKCMVFNL